MEPILLREVKEDGIVILQINRPAQMNAINFAMIEELQSALDWAEQDETIKVLILRGAGDRAFCSGGDLGEFHTLTTKESAYKMLWSMGRLLLRIAEFPRPTIAYLNGAAVGGGCEIAAACDFRLASEGAKVGFIQGNQAITTGWGGASLLYEKLQPASALEMLYSGKVYRATEAIDMGFVQRQVAGIEEVLEFAAPIAAKQSAVLAAYKEALVKKWAQSRLAERIEEEIRSCSFLWEGDDHLNAVRAFNSRSK
ncbi:enoyl-CoA hydratase/isomerase family protein [Bacillus testis]|uniref:enoyl-CoA hydratase/isomerase family protein n=1 Tax=Bacillus testis TaxID=1622072 RepID=UPI00067EA59E|nr:enoyl-CoA hydratase/isomerase family protein [Bacillus testis]